MPINVKPRPAGKTQPGSIPPKKSGSKIAQTMRSLEKNVAGKGFVATLSDGTIKIVPTREEAKRRWGPIPARAKAPAPWYEEYGISKAIIDEAQVRHVSDLEARKTYAINGKADWSLDGIVFPHLHPESGEMRYVRLRVDEPDPHIGLDKYIGNSAEDADRIPYIHPRGAKRLKQEGVTVLIVEAEKSVLAIESWLERAKRDDLVPLAMGGCTGWRSKEHRILPGMHICEGHDIIVALDSNADTNKSVFAARLKLTAYLQSLGCSVHLAKVPKLGGKANGPDDVLGQKDGDAIWEKVLGSAQTADVAPYSEHALAELFANQHREDVCFVPNIGWRVFDGTRWKFDDEQHVELLVQELCRAAARHQLKPADQNKLRSRRTREAILREAQAHMIVNLDRFDTDIMLFNTPKGTVDLRTGDILPAQRGDYITKLAGASPSPHKPERWISFMREITLEEHEFERYLQKLFGYFLSGSVKMEELYVLFGDGSNGKGKFAEAILGILGEYGMTIPAEMLMARNNEAHPTEIAMLCGARLAVASETEDGSRWHESRIKTFTGGDRQRGRFMRQDFFEYMPQFKLLIQANHRPKLRNVGNAIKRRLRMAPFNASFLDESKRDRDLSAKLKSEYGGILSWAIEGCIMWLSEGLQPPKIVSDATEEYFESQDALGIWIEERVVMDQKAKSNSTTLYENFQAWCEKRGEYFIPSQRDFSMKLKDRGFTTMKSHGVTAFIGLRFRDTKEAVAHAVAVQKVVNMPKHARPKAAG